MIDTAIITLPQNRFIVQDYSRFGTTKAEFLAVRGFRKYFNNPTAQQKRDGTYLPRLTLFKRGLTINLKIEFSIPKLLFGNNLDEVSDEDKDKIIKTLLQKITDMEVMTTEKFIKEAEVSAFHPSKNILLTNGYTASFAIKELAKINLNRKLDFSDTKFRNDGTLLQYYSVLHSFVIYDKMSDLKKPKTRAVDKDQPIHQLSLLAEIKDFEKHIEILRLEVRLSKKRKMNAVLKTVGYPENPSFEKIINEEMWKKVIKYYWDTMIADKNIFIFDILSNPLRILQRAIKNNRGIKPKQAIYLTGLEILCKDKGIRELRQTIEIISKTKAWYNISNDIVKINSYKKDLEPHGFIKDIEGSINKFNAFRLSTYKLDTLQ